MEVDEGYDRKSDIFPHWITAHALLKNEFTEDEKNHNLIDHRVFSHGECSKDGHQLACDANKVEDPL